MPTVNYLNTDTCTVILIEETICETGVRDLFSSYPDYLNVPAAICVCKGDVAFIFELDMIFRCASYCIQI